METFKEETSSVGAQMHPNDVGGDRPSVRILHGKQIRTPTRFILSKIHRGRSRMQPVVTQHPPTPNPPNPPNINKSSASAELRERQEHCVSFGNKRGKFKTIIDWKTAPFSRCRALISDGTDTDTWARAGACLEGKHLIRFRQRKVNYCQVEGSLVLTEQ